jgi:hypothetical protein
LPVPYLGTWLKSRDLPAIPQKSFREVWKDSKNV